MIDQFVDRALDTADLLQGYVDIAGNQIDKLTPSEKERLKEHLENRIATCGAGSLAILFVLAAYKEE